MSKAPSPEYRKARAAVFRAIVTEPDGVVPDAVKIVNDNNGLLVRFSLGDLHLQRMMSWVDWNAGRGAFVVEMVKLMLEELARADMEAS